MGALIILVVVVWLIESSEGGEWGQPQWAGVGVLIALLLTVCVLGVTDRGKS